MLRLIPSILAASFLLIGCNEEPAVPNAQARQRAEESERRLAEDRLQRERLDARLREEQTRTSKWQLAAVLAVGAAGFTLIFGTILGSRARHEVRKK